MNKTALVLALVAIGGLASAPAFAELKLQSNWVDSRGIYQIYLDYDCRDLGHGQIRYSLFDDYVYVEKTTQTYSETWVSSRTFTHDDWSNVIAPWYVKTYSPSADKC